MSQSHKAQEREGTMKRATFAIGIAAALLTAPFGAGVALADVKIGAVLSATGPASFLGDHVKKTLEMYAADINAKGGINGQPITNVISVDGRHHNHARTFAIQN